MHWLPVAAAVSEVLPLLQQRLHKGAANAGVAVSVHPVGEPRARDADLGGVEAKDRPAASSISTGMTDEGGGLISDMGE